VNDFGRIRLGEWLSRVEKTAKSADSRAISRRRIETNLNDFAYHERVEEMPGIKGSWRLRHRDASRPAAGSGEFEAKSRLGVQAKVTVFLLPPDGVC
jgi:hypothetical protein